jgi:hypothetical protein
MPNNILELLHCWKTQGRGHSNQAIWKVIPTLLIQSILRGKKKKFKKISDSLKDCKSNVLCLKSSSLSSLSWAVAYIPNFSTSNHVDFVHFLEDRHQYGSCILLYTFCVRELCLFLINYCSSQRNIRVGADQVSCMEIVR